MCQRMKDEWRSCRQTTSGRVLDRGDEELGSPVALVRPTGERYLLIDSERRIFGRGVLGVHGSLHHRHSPAGILGVTGGKLMKPILAAHPKRSRQKRETQAPGIQVWEFLQNASSPEHVKVGQPETSHRRKDTNLRKLKT